MAHFQSNKIIKSKPYKITGDPNQADLEKQSPKLQKLMLDMHDMATAGKQNAVKQLLELIEKYPDIPIFKNYLSAVYERIGQKEKAYELTREIYATHPDYLVGRTNLALQSMLEGNLEEVPKLLGERLEISALYPNRKVFHISEIVNYNCAASRYLIEKGELDQAENKIVEMEAIDHLNSQVKIARELIEVAKVKKGLEQFRANAEKSKERQAIYKPSLVEQTNQPPVLHHPELKALYEHDLYIPASLIEQLLALPRPTLIIDLENILWDAARRYHYFFDTAGDGQEKEVDFALHAFSLLSDLKATESLPTILKFWKQDEEMLKFWFGDHTTETIWEFFYHLGDQQLSLLQAFVQQPNIGELEKSVIVTAVFQIALRQPERRAEVEEWIASVLQFMLDNHSNEAIADAGFNAMTIWKIGDYLKSPQLLPIIKQLYEVDEVDELIVGDYEDILEVYKKKERQDIQMYVFSSTIERYQHILETWSGYGEKQESSKTGNLDDLDFLHLLKNIDKNKSPILLGDSGNPLPYHTTYTEPVVRQGNKTGRNDPCPCGSGKKYKKCCWNKDH